MLRAARLTILLLVFVGAVPLQAGDLLSAMRLRETIISGERRVAIIETSHGDQRLITEGEKLADCLVKRIRSDGIDLECRGHARSLGFEGRARIAATQRTPPGL